MYLIGCYAPARHCTPKEIRYLGKDAVPRIKLEAVYVNALCPVAVFLELAKDIPDCRCFSRTCGTCNEYILGLAAFQDRLQREHERAYFSIPVWKPLWHMLRVEVFLVPENCALLCTGTFKNIPFHLRT